MIDPPTNLMAIKGFHEASQQVDRQGTEAIGRIQDWLGGLPSGGWPRPHGGLADGGSWPDGDR